jgi:hypothetical protein
MDSNTTKTYFLKRFKTLYSYHLSSRENRGKGYACHKVGRNSQSFRFNYKPSMSLKGFRISLLCCLSSLCDSRSRQRDQHESICTQVPVTIT